MITRRDFVKQAAVGAGLAAGAAALADDGPAGQADAMPPIDLGGVKVSRLILGSNPFFGFSHFSGDLDREMVEYYTDDRICEILEQAAALGITAVAAPVYDRWITLFGRYREQGGRLRTWLAQPDGAPEGLEDEFRRAVDGGAAAVFVQGHRAEVTFSEGRMDLLGKWVEAIRTLGVPAGLAAHQRDVHLAVEKAGLPTSFYFQCFYVPDRDWAENAPREAVDVIRQIEKPVIAYKILAAGRREPEAAFRFALEGIRPKDGICVGMFPKHDTEQMAQNVRLTLRFAGLSREA